MSSGVLRDRVAPSFVEASARGDLNFDCLVFRSVPGEVSASAPISSELPAWLEPRGGTLLSSKAAWSEVFALGACSAPSDWACVVEGSHSRGSRPDIVSIVKMGDDMVVVFSFDAFARDELLAGRLVSFVDGL